MVSFCVCVSVLCENSGGMMRGPAAKTRCTMALFSGSPGTIGTVPAAVGLRASSRISSRMPAIRELRSGPWQRKQVSAMIGRISRLNCTCACAASANIASARGRDSIGSHYTPGARHLTHLDQCIYILIDTDYEEGRIHRAVSSPQKPLVPRDALARRWRAARVRHHAGGSRSHRPKGAPVARDPLRHPAAADGRRPDRRIPRAPGRGGGRSATPLLPPDAPGPARARRGEREAGGPGARDPVEAWARVPGGGIVSAGLAAERLTKRYNSIAAVDDVSFTIEPGEILGYVGPNGAGKSTTVKMLIGLVGPSDGRILYNGRPVSEGLPA